MGDTATAQGRPKARYKPAPFAEILAERGPYGWMNFSEIAVALGMRYEKAKALYDAGAFPLELEDLSQPGASTRSLRTTVAKVYTYLTGQPCPEEARKTA